MEKALKASLKMLCKAKAIAMPPTPRPTTAPERSTLKTPRIMSKAKE